ncbi:PRC-barrel domain-containing protein [Streptomyces sp. SID8352]|uniref:PRC-barrel domain-containing protein n=1 Tax=unclassified Streptomyces TaxID=2593676 RepID=UPI0013691711|nr:PRC-barrel domain-containing protein [Streptomyces sp. SID8352]MYU23674.1 PRC-barrel domain containing protein [Streptomyces sp. SID8352]
MDELMAARSLGTRPVVTLGGDTVALVRDTVFDDGAGWITGFTLSRPGLRSGPLKEGLPWATVHALGHEAVMVRDRRCLVALAVMTVRQESLRARLLGAALRTEEGRDVGTVLDVVVEGGGSGRVVGFRVAAGRGSASGSRRRGRTVYVPRGESLAVAGRTLVVPGEAVRETADDLAGLAVLVARARGASGGGRGAP